MFTNHGYSGTTIAMSQDIKKRIKLAKQHGYTHVVLPLKDFMIWTECKVWTVDELLEMKDNTIIESWSLKGTLRLFNLRKPYIEYGNIFECYCL